MSLDMSLETFKHLIRFFLIIGIASSVSAIFTEHELSRGNVVHTNLISNSPQTTCPQAAPLYPDRHNDLWTNFSTIIKIDDFKSRAFGRLSRAVQFK